MSVDEHVTVRCLGLAHGGMMISQIVSGPEGLVGKKAFVRGLIPEEEALVTIREDRKSFAVAELQQITTASASRIAPPCPVFGECGGCDLQYLPVSAQREMKREMVEKTLQRQGRLVLPEPVKIFGRDLPAIEYRRRISLHLDSEGNLGFYREGSADVVPIQQCLIASAKINGVLVKLRGIAAEICTLVSGITVEEFAESGVPVFLLRHKVDSKQVQELEQQVGALFPLGKIFYLQQQLSEWHAGLSESQALEFSTVRHFSQINQAGNEVLIEQVLRALSDEDEISEFYAGAGNFSFPLARAGKRVDAIELDRQLVDRGKAQVQMEKLSGLRFIADSTERFIDQRSGDLRQAVLFDPPRSGAAALCESLFPSQVRTIVYVSCALPTLTRDLATLVRNGFTVVETGIIDMFPQTHHVESISVLKRAS